MTARLRILLTAAVTLSGVASAAPQVTPATGSPAAPADGHAGSSTVQQADGEADSLEAASPAEVELRALRDMLEAWPERDNWTTPYLNPCPEISSRLALFEARFGVSPRWTPGWGALAATARDVLDALTEQTKRPIRGVAHEDQWFGPPWSQMRALLLEVGGCADDARALLFETDAIQMSGCCVWCESGDLHTLERARGEFLWRAGELQNALVHLASACMQGSAVWVGEVATEAADADSALAATCYGMLLVRSGEEQVGGVNAGVLVLESVVRDLPGSLGAAIAANELADAGVSVGETTGRLVSVLLGPYMSAYGAIPCALLAGRDGDPDCWRLLALRTVNPGPEWESLTWSVWTSREALEQQRPFLMDRLAGDDGVARAAALLTLQGLDGTWRARLGPHLDRFATERGDAWAVGQVDEKARWLCGDGPAFEDLSKVTPQALCDAWRAWLAAR